MLRVNGLKIESVSAQSVPSGRVSAMLVGVLAGIFFFHTLAEGRLKSPTSDESPHIASGLSYLATGIFRGNPQHPPLLKELSGLSMMLGGIRWPDTPETRHFLHGTLSPGEQPEWEIGSDIIAGNGPDRVLFWARLPFVLIASMLGVLIYLWGRQLAGELAALCAVFLFTTDPTIVAHSYTVTTDVGLAAFTVLLLFAIWQYVRNPSLRMLGWCGLALGAVLCAKFSAVLLIPVIGVLLLAAVKWPAGQDPGRPRTPLDPFYWPPQAAAKVGTEKRKAGRNDPCPCGSGKKYKACHGARGSTQQAAAPDNSRRMALCAVALLAMLAVACVVIEAVYFFPSEPMAYLHGLRMVNADHNPNYLVYLAGSMQHRFYSYFAAAFALKEPIAALILIAIGLAAVLRNGCVSGLGKWFLLFPPAFLFLITTLSADDIGIRYIMPVLPFAHLLGGIGAATLLTMTAKWGRGLAVVLGLWLIVAAVGIYPDDLSYMNESACLLTDAQRVGFDGGSKCGYYWLDDSNVDWGGGLKQLKRWMDVNAGGRTIKVANPFWFPPSAYGIAAEAENIPEQGDPVPGLHAVSASLVARIPTYPGASDWLRRIPPVAVVGHGLYIYDIPAPQGSAKH
jgi:SEC-C motif/Dolichyl-phosphate-mannose-protein mannosyltransferase